MQLLDLMVLSKDNYSEIKFTNKKQVGDKIACGLGEGFLSFPVFLEFFELRKV